MKVVLTHHSNHPDCKGKIGDVVECPDALVQQWTSEDPRKRGCLPATEADLARKPPPATSGRKTSKQNVRSEPKDTASESGD